MAAAFLGGPSRVSSSGSSTFCAAVSIGIRFVELED